MSGGARAMSDEEELMTEPPLSPRNDHQATDRGQPDYASAMRHQLTDPSLKTWNDTISAATPGERFSDVSQPDMSPPPGSRTSYQDLGDLSMSEVESFGDEVMGKLNKAVEKFPRAQGLFVCFSNSRGCDGAVEVPNIHRSSDKMCAVYSELGFAHCSFKDSPRAEIAAVFKQLSAMSLPKSYKSVIIYYAGHGKDWCLNVEDGYLAISYLIEILSKTGENQLKNLAKVIVFDCCRTTSGLAPPQFPIPQDTMVVYSTALGQKTFIVDDRGLTVVGIELVKLLEREQSCRLTDLFQVDLNKVLNEKNETSHLVNWQGCLLSNPDLYMEKLRAMSPSGISLMEYPEQDVCVLKWRRPVHADHQHLLYFFIASQREGHWDYISRSISSSLTECELPRASVRDKKLTVIAKYASTEVVAADINQSCAVLQSECLVPEDVCMNISATSAVLLTWSRLKHGRRRDSKEIVSIERAPIDETLDNWEEVLVAQEIRNQKYVVPGEDADQFNYRIKIHKDDMCCRWITADKREGLHMRSKKNSCCSIVLPSVVIVVLAVLAILCVGSAIASAIAFWKKHEIPTRTTLAFASDFIDCSQSIQYGLYDKVTITQNKHSRDSILQVDGYRIARSNLKFHSINFPFSSHWNNMTGDIRTVVPDGYTQRPFYMRENSTISFDLVLTCERFIRAALYLFDNSTKADTFISNKEEDPKYTNKSSLVAGANQVTFSIKTSSYYYVVADVQCDGRVQYADNVTVHVVYIDSDDYKNNSKIFTIGDDEMPTSVGISTSEVILCFINPVTSSKDSPSTHLTISYSIRAASVVWTAVVLLVFMAASVLVVCSCIVKLARRCRRNQTRQYGRL